MRIEDSQLLSKVLRGEVKTRRPPLWWRIKDYFIPLIREIVVFTTKIHGKSLKIIPIVLLMAGCASQIKRSNYEDMNNVWFAYMPFYDEASGKVKISNLVLDMSNGYARHDFDYIYLEIYDLKTEQWMMMRFKTGKWEINPNHKPVKLERK